MENTTSLIFFDNIVRQVLGDGAKYKVNMKIYNDQTQLLI